ncbi:adenylyl-sulfate kinase [Candidatus Woesearchaeota archaeon]|nr:adenylyl-sulfate kinase [Candidatus Woesearchaeota archaeon]
MAPGAEKVLEDYISQKGVVLWFTGLPFSGKTTIANAVADRLKEKGFKTERLQSKVLRTVLGKDLGFSKEDREKNLDRATFMAKMLARNGVIVLSSFITPYESIRSKIRSELEKDSTFIEVFLDASVETCKKRDDKGLYEKAQKGEIKDFTGVSDPFEEPKNAEITLDTEKNGVEENVEKVLKYLEGVV